MEDNINSEIIMMMAMIMTMVKMVKMTMKIKMVMMVMIMIMMMVKILNLVSLLAVQFLPRWSLHSLVGSESNFGESEEKVQIKAIEPQSNQQLELCSSCKEYFRGTIDDPRLPFLLPWNNLC